MELILEIKILLEDLRYEPFELFLRNFNFEILDDKKNRQLIFLGLKTTKDKIGFVGQCEELAYVAIKRIKNKFPNLRFQIWSGRDNIYFNNKEGHRFILIKNSFFSNKNIIVDPSFGIVDFENNLNYSKDKLQYDTKKYDGLISYLDGTLQYNLSSPIFYDKITRNLFYVIFNEKDRIFYLYIDDKLTLDLNIIRKYTNNKRFIFFCEKISNYHIKEFKGEFKPRENLIEI